MMFAGFLFLLLLTAEVLSDAIISSEIRDGQKNFHQLEEESGSTFEELIHNSTQNPVERATSAGMTSSQIQGQLKNCPKLYKDDPYYKNSYKCSFYRLLRQLKIGKKHKDMLTLVRPVEDYRETTEVELHMVVAGILDLKEIDQTLIIHVVIYMYWRDPNISWNQTDFCGLNNIAIPTKYLWMPDVSIEEMIEKDKAEPNPFLLVDSGGNIEYKNDQVVICICKMQIYKFPFDIQTCNISIKSSTYNEKELKFVTVTNASKITQWSKELMRSQYEWLFINMSAINIVDETFDFNQSTVIYTLKMKRRPIHYIVNFMLPIMFFLCLDFASFLISEVGGEKLSFKVTVLLAVTVMQLILNDILPSSSDKIPLIAVYCIGIFGLMMVSLLETILIMYLLEKGENQNEDTDDKKPKAISNDCSTTELTEEPQTLEQESVELRDIDKTLSLLLNLKGEKQKPGFWTIFAKTVHKIFFILYVTVTSLLLVVLFFVWNFASDE